MIYTAMTIKAMKLAYDAHAGQIDSNNVPYIFHPYHVAEQMDDEISCTVALLHDIIEDTNVTVEDLEKDFPSEVVEAVKLLTHTDNVDYQLYLEKIKNNPVAKKVKLEDIKHNSDETRCNGTDIPHEQLCRWRKKYAKARALLLEE